MKILITGGCGFTGTILTNDLIKLGHKVKVIDTQWFGCNLKKNKNLEIIKKDIRNIKKNDIKNSDVIVHLANIPNDLSVELNPNLSWDVNVIAIKKLIELSIECKVKKFIYASSGSVYGIKKEKKVTEDLSLKPISVYNKTKMIAERVLMSYSDKIKIFCIRPATVCGYSPRMRADVSVNMFIYQALKNKRLTIFGGQQIRPNITIKDLSNVYKHFIFKKLKPGFYNAGFENLKILNIAEKVKKFIDCKIIIKKNNNDPRSYRQNSDKLIKTGFKVKYKIDDAIKDIIEMYKKNKKIFSKNVFSVKTINRLNIK